MQYKAPMIIAEAGVNHNGSFERAVEMIDVAKAAGADAIKFQSFITSKLVTTGAKKANYQVKNSGQGGSQYDMLKALELSFEQQKALTDYCSEVGLTFISTPFDEESLDFLIHELKLDTIKIGSGDLTNAPLLQRCAQSDCRLIVSTGMSTLAQVEQAVQIIAEQKGQGALKDSLTLLHCTSQYPAPMESLNLKAIATLQKTFDLPVGYSDHSEGILVASVVTGLGAVMIEKHFTLDKTLPGPDHCVSISPNELRQMITNVKAIASAMGDGVKKPHPVELDTFAVASKSLVASQSIKAGECFTADNLTVKRPGSGISPTAYWDYLGKIAGRDYVLDELIESEG